MRHGGNEWPRRTAGRPGCESGPLVLLGLLVVSAICAGSVVGAIEFHGVPRVVAIVFAIVSGLYLAWWIVMALLALTFFSMLEPKPSVAGRSARVLIAAGIGALFGTDTYADGVQGLLAGPTLILLVLAAVHAAPDISPRARRIAREMSIIAGVAAIGVGITIFL